MNRIITASLVALATSVNVTDLAAQASYQELFSDVGIGMEGTVRVFAYADGSTVVQQWSDTLDLLFTRFDASGAPIWRRSVNAGVQAAGAPPMAKTPDGGFLVAAVRTTLFPGDSCLTDITKFNSAGATEWSKSVVVEANFGSSAQGPMTIACNSNGDIFLANLVAGIGSYVTKFSPAGVAVWTRHITDPDIETGIDQSFRIEALDDGGCIFLGEGWYTNTFAIGRLDATGAPLWMKMFTYDALSAYFDNIRIVPYPDGEYIITAQLSMTNVGPYAFVARIDPNGTWLASDLYEYEHDYMLPLFQGIQEDNGNLLLTGGYFPMANAHCTRIGNNGQVISALQTRTAVTGAVKHQVYYLPNDIANDSLHMTGALTSYDTVFGTEDYTALLWKSAPDMSGLCALDPINVAHLSVPAALMLSEDVGAVQPITLPTIPFAVTNTAYPVPSTSTFCGLVGITETPSPVQFLIVPNPVSRGTGLSITAETNGVVEVLDALGRLVRRATVTQGSLTLTAPSVAGWYCVRYVPTRGAAVVKHIVVE